MTWADLLDRAAYFQIREPDFWNMSPAEFERWAYNAAVKDEHEWHRWRVLVAQQINIHARKGSKKEATDILFLPIMDAQMNTHKLQRAKAALEVDFSAWDKIKKR